MLKGSYVALVTPFKRGEVDYSALESLIDFHLENQTHGILLLGTTGEAASLASDEREALLRFAINRIAGRVPVMIGTGTNNLQQTLQHTAKAKELGADYALVLTPYYIKPTQGGMVEYFGAIASKIDVPIVIYNVPGRTGVNILPPAVLKIAKAHSNVVGIKEASGSVVQATQIIRDAPQGFSVMSGEDALNYPLIAIGAMGTISVTANVAPLLMSQHIETALSGDMKKAAEQHRHLQSLNDAMFIETNPIPAKESLAMMGLIQKELRLPMCDLQEANRQSLAKVLQSYGLI